MQDYSLEGADIPWNLIAPLMQLLVNENNNKNDHDDDDNADIPWNLIAPLMQLVVLKIIMIMENDKNYNQPTPLI